MGSRQCTYWLALAGLCVLAAAALPVAAQTTEPEAAAVARIAGTDRYDTARLIADDAFPHGAETVLVARGGQFPDALAGAYLAGQRSAPVLLTASGTVPEATAAGLSSLGPSTVVVLGGTGAIGPEVVASLEASGYEVERIGGEDRYETARLVAESGATIGTLPGDGPAAARERSVVLATGEGFADALAAGPLAYAAQLPILLTPPDVLSPHARAVLADEALGIERVLIAGGTRAVSQAVEDAVVTMGKAVDRIAGADRTETAALIAERTAMALGWDLTEVNLASGAGFADALVVAPRAGETETVLVLAASRDEIGGPTAALLAAHCAETSRIVIAGGTAAVSDDVAGQGARAATCRVPTTLTLEPEDSEAPVGTRQTLVATLTDQFGEPVPGADVQFEVYRDRAATPVHEPARLTTDASGMAAFAYAYEGPEAAADRIVACMPESLGLVCGGGPGR